MDGSSFLTVKPAFWITNVVDSPRTSENATRKKAFSFISYLEKEGFSFCYSRRENNMAERPRTTESTSEKAFSFIFK